jgi:hypothetical protein
VCACGFIYANIYKKREEERERRERREEIERGTESADRMNSPEKENKLFEFKDNVWSEVSPLKDKALKLLIKFLKTLD